MANNNNADDPYAEGVEIEETPSLFSYAEDQPIVEEAETEQAAEPAEPTPTDDEAQTQGKDSPEGEEPVAEEPEEELVSDEEPVAEEPSDDDVPESEKKRFEYWQSKHDKTKAELEKLKAQYEGLPDEVIEVAKHITKRPELLDTVEAAINGKQPNPTPSQNGEQANIELPERPKKPEKPAGYDHFEALNDPQSESYQYLAAKEQYEDDLQEWLVKREEVREAQQEQARKQREAQQAQQAQLNKVVNNLRDGYDMKDTEIKEFFDVINSEPDLDDLVKYYRVKTGKTPEPVTDTRKEQLKARRKKSKQSPPPAATTASAANDTPKPKPEESGPFVYKG